MYTQFVHELGFIYHQLKRRGGAKLRIYIRQM